METLREGGRQDQGERLMGEGGLQWQQHILRSYPSSQARPASNSLLAFMLAEERAYVQGDPLKARRPIFYLSLLGNLVLSLPMLRICFNSKSELVQDRIELFRVTIS